MVVALAAPASAQVTDRELLFCAAVFKLRVDRLEEWQGDTTAAQGWAWAMRRALAQRKAPEPECGPSLLFTPCKQGWGVPIWHETLRVERLYERMGVMRTFPLTCIEDDACASCLDLLRMLRD